MRHNHFRHGLELIARDEQERNLKQAMYAVAHIAQATRSPPFGWEPLFRVKPTHIAIFRTLLLENGSFRTEFVEDVPAGELRYASDGKPISNIYDNIPEKYNDEECANDEIFFVYVPYDEERGSAEWVPPIGPAPIWSHPTAARLPRIEMYALLEQFQKEIYGT